MARGRIRLCGKFVVTGSRSSSPEAARLAIRLGRASTALGRDRQGGVTLPPSASTRRALFRGIARNLVQVVHCEAPSAPQWTLLLSPPTTPPNRYCTTVVCAVSIAPVSMYSAGSPVLTNGWTVHTSADCPPADLDSPFPR